jgi:hypothetical protein
MMALIAGPGIDAAASRRRRGRDGDVQPRARALSRRGGLKLERTKVGDRYVLEAMRAGGYNVGGEQSGHMILLDHATTGDGTIAALQVLAELVRAGKPASELLHLFDPVPQLLKNVAMKAATARPTKAVSRRRSPKREALAGKGRLVIRKSGTEPVIRVMAEGDDRAQVEAVVDAICEDLDDRCPNCGGELMDRPTRAKALHAKFPPCFGRVLERMIVLSASDPNSRR